MSVEDERKLFVAGLAESVTEDALRQLFEAEGCTVESATVPRDRATGLGRGFAFVTVQTPEQAEAARQALDGMLHDGKAMSVRPFRGDRSSGPPPPRTGAAGPGFPPRAPRPAAVSPSDDASVYVGNLPYNATSEDVQRVFESLGFGPVQRVHLPTDPEGRPRGFGFVALADPEAARRAADGMAQAQMGGRTISVSLARARASKPPPGMSGPPSMGATRPPRSFEEGTSAPSGAPGQRTEPRSIAPRFFEIDSGPNTRGDDERRARGVQAPMKKKEKKKKAGTQERGPKRRDNEGFRSPRGRGMLNDWDED